jgi:hypothetical protein
MIAEQPLPLTEAQWKAVLAVEGGLKPLDFPMTQEPRAVVLGLRRQRAILKPEHTALRRAHFGHSCKFLDLYFFERLEAMRWAG